MRHVVLDTNALIQALPSRSRYHKIWTDFRFHLLSDIDKDDDKFVDCAITAGADYIVTEEQPFRPTQADSLPKTQRTHTR